MMYKDFKLNKEAQNTAKLLPKTKKVNEIFKISSQDKMH